MGFFDNLGMSVVNGDKLKWDTHNEAYDFAIAIVE